MARLASTNLRSVNASPEEVGDSRIDNPRAVNTTTQTAAIELGIRDNNTPIKSELPIPGRQTK
jgi:hypothetical protein